MFRLDDASLLFPLGWIFLKFCPNLSRYQALTLFTPYQLFLNY